MTRCIIKSNIVTLYNKVSFVDINNENVISFGYLMFEDDLSLTSKEFICERFQCISRRDALNFALTYNNKCDSLKCNFYSMESYIFDTSAALEEVARTSAAITA